MIELGKKGERKEARHPVVEMFGPVLQGEGALIGQPVHFVRFGGCDYACSWCDSKYAVIPSEVKANSEMLTDGEIADGLDALEGHPRWVVLSGGNPALQHLDGLMDELHRRGYKVTIETQGTVFRPWIRKVDKVTVSPKPPSSGNITEMRTVDDFRILLENPPVDPEHREDGPGRTDAPPSPDLSYKVVIFDEGDFVYLRQLVRHLKGRYEVFASVGNNVGQDGRDDLLSRLNSIAGFVMRDPELAGVRCLPQLHVLQHGNARGV